MRAILFLIFVFFGLCSANYWRPPTDDKSCGFTRDDALACALKYGDTNHDGKLDQRELANAKYIFVPRYLRLLAWIKGIDLSRILKDCDYDKDGVLTPRDWQQSKDTCMPKQENLCQFKWFCDYAKSKSKQ